MKHRYTTLLLSVFIISGITLASAQEVPFKRSPLHFGVSTDLLSLPLSEKGAVSQKKNVFIGYSFTDNLSLKLNFSAITLFNTGLNYYNDFSALGLDLGYIVHRSANDLFDTQVYAAFSNGISDFGAFRNYSADLGVRFYMFKFAYLGVGGRYNGYQLQLQSSKKHGIDLTCQIGIQFDIVKPSKLRPSKKQE